MPETATTFTLRYGVSMGEPKTATLISGRYRLEQQLGEGGMGSVWVAEDETLHRWVAVKLMNARCSTSKSANERFEREAMAIARMRSPHVVQVFDYGVDRDIAFMAMELLHGEDLYSWLRKHRPVPLDMVTDVVTQIAKGLVAAHRAGIVHRDLKPANVFVVKEHDEECIKVFDFGLAKGLADLGPLKDQTGEGVLLGTPRYMSPEQAHGAKRVDHRSDLWSLGVIAYLAITGRLPFRGKGVGEVITKIATEAPIPPTELVPGLPVEVDRFFLTALAKRPDDRFQSAQEFAEAFAELSGTALASMEFGTPMDLQATEDGDTLLDDTHADVVFVPPVPSDEQTTLEPESVDSGDVVSRDARRVAGKRSADAWPGRRRPPPPPRNGSRPLATRRLIGLGLVAAAVTTVVMAASPPPRAHPLQSGVIGLARAPIVAVVPAEAVEAPDVPAPAAPVATDNGFPTPFALATTRADPRDTAPDIDGPDEPKPAGDDDDASDPGGLGHFTDRH